MISASELDAMLKVLQANGVRAAKLGEYSFDLAPMPQTSATVHPLDVKAREREKAREFEELLYASSGG